MNSALLAGAAVALGGVGVYLLIPRGTNAGRRTGIGLASGGLVLLWVLWGVGFEGVQFLAGLVFYLLGTLTVIAAAMTVTQRSPVVCALWFACVVIGTAGLFLLQNAQFLAAATVIVYAGAIVVLFLFVIMLAQQKGTERHDRLSREPALAVVSSCVLLLATIVGILSTYKAASLAPSPGGAAVSQTAFLDLESPHVAGLGAALFTEHWVSLEVAGSLLLVAMVGAILIAARSETASTREIKE